MQDIERIAFLEPKLRQSEPTPALCDLDPDDFRERPHDLCQLMDIFVYIAK